jgi:RNA polymerase sigma-70 factor (ECF subfamily)
VLVPALDGLRDDEFRAAYAAHGQELYRVAHRALRDGGLAEDAVQETFVRAWRAVDRYDPDRASPRTWLFAILRNVVIDLHRARSVRPPVAAPADDGAADGGVAADDDAYERALVSWQVEAALERLRPEHRRALVEVYYRGRPYAEAAVELGVAVGTVKSRVFYALRSLRDALEEMGWRP